MERMDKKTSQRVVLIMIAWLVLGVALFTLDKFYNVVGYIYILAIQLPPFGIVYHLLLLKHLRRISFGGVDLLLVMLTTFVLQGGISVLFLLV